MWCLTTACGNNSMTATHSILPLYPRYTVSCRHNTKLCITLVAGSVNSFIPQSLKQPKEMVGYGLANTIHGFPKHPKRRHCVLTHTIKLATNCVCVWQHVNNVFKESAALPIHTQRCTNLAIAKWCHLSQ